MSTFTLNPEQQSVVDEITKQIPSNEELAAATRNLTLADAMRLGSDFTEQAQGWGTGREACALHAAAQVAYALGYIEK